MNRLFKYSSLGVLATLFLFNSCTELQENPGRDNEGKPTYMGISISFPKSPETRAVTVVDSSATAYESDFTTLDVFIFNTATGTQMTSQTFLQSDFTQGASTATSDTWTMKGGVSISTSTGERTLLVGLNIPPALLSQLKGIPLGDFLNKVFTVPMSQLANQDGLVMFSPKETLCTFVDDPTDPANHPTVEVVRMVAKVTLEEASGGIVMTGAGQTFDYEFAVFNSNTKSFMVPKVDYKDPNWDDLSFTPSDFEDLSANYLAVSPHREAINTRLAAYAAENTTEQRRQKEITRVVVRTKFLPAEVYVYANGTDASGGFSLDASHGITVPQTFWSVTEAGGSKRFFFDENTAQDYQTANPTTTLDKYTDAYCYYNLFLNPRGVYAGVETLSRVFDVYRNDYYRCTVQKVLAPGNPTPNVTNPDNPPATSSSIQVDVEVLFWNTISDVYELEP
ncbi:MAG: Mfa1 family fimbria major subunit [Tannerella sp.]|jgi:hypothetical protein|nr:Mfa1 family fimbria major subunit [Tannerella sp.]